MSIDRLQRLLRPAGGGIHTVSTGVAQVQALQRGIYGPDVDARWRRQLESVSAAKVAILGVPSDTGAGFARGAAFGPGAIRTKLLSMFPDLYDDPRVVDLGDVPVVPHLLHDEMLDPEQIQASRAALYGDHADDEAWPVSALSIAEAVLDQARALNPEISPLLLGGDHSVGWPGLAAVARGREAEVGILHFDAHTDLLAHRQGVRYCFATWAFHANELVGRGQRLQQVGLRISGRTREHWEQSCDVRQYWAEECHRRSVDDIAEEITGAFARAGVRGVYVSNDIDGTDPAWAAATGTPEDGGLSPEMVLGLIERIAEAYPLWGSDVVEVAPILAGAVEGEPDRTLTTAARYVHAQAMAALSRTPSPPGA